MQRYYYDRESVGPDFDNRLIQLVRKNPAIYDVNHPNYRRNPVRVAIWARIASELGAPSRYLQTKWKNIRYNYLQEVKCLETGQTNSNIRKRRFTEDLSFLQKTAKTYKTISWKNYSYNSSDNDSNSYLQPDPVVNETFEVIEIVPSDDESVSALDAEMANKSSLPEQLNFCTPDALPINGTDAEPFNDFKGAINVKSKDQLYTKSSSDGDVEAEKGLSACSSPLLTPLAELNNGHLNNINSEVTIEPIPKCATISKQERVNEIMTNAVKRKSMPTPFPVLTPINDPIELYCLSLVDSLRSMPRSERERVKYEFSKILKDAKYKDQS